MKRFDDIFKSVQWQQIIQESLINSSQLSELVRNQASITKSLSGLSMLSELAKSMEQHHKNLKNVSLSAVEAMTKGLSLRSEFAIPKTTLDAILSINRQHEQLFSGIRAMAEALKIQTTALAQINNLNFGLRGISGQLAAISASQYKWDLIGDFEEITDEAVALNEKYFDEYGVTKEGLNELKAFLQRIEIKVDKIDTNAKELFWKLIALLSFILAGMGEARNWITKPEYATKQEIETVFKEQFSLYERKLKEEKQYRSTNRVCKVMLKPRSKSLAIEKLPVDFEVIILQVNHKWIYVTYFSPVDNLPQTGWIMKKYLDKSQ